MRFLITFWVIARLIMINLILKILFQSITHEKIHNVSKEVVVCEILILGGLLKKVTRKPLKVSLNTCYQIFFI